MAEPEFCQFKKGDIVKNNYAGKRNPFQYLMYWKKGSIRQGRYTQKTYDCIGYNGEIVHFYRDDNRLERIGHMDEYDAFLSALKRLKDLNHEQEES